jgi:hypothetical protein
METRELGTDAQRTYSGQEEKADRARVLEYWKPRPPRTVRAAEVAGPMSSWTAGEIREERLMSQDRRHPRQLEWSEEEVLKLQD